MAVAILVTALVIGFWHRDDGGQDGRDGTVETAALSVSSVAAGTQTPVPSPTATSGAPPTVAAAASTVVPERTIDPLAGGCWTADQIAPPIVAGEDAVVPQWSAPPASVLVDDRTYRAIVDTDRGTFTIELEAAGSASAGNFACLARAHFFDGVAFDRITVGAVYGGDPTGSGSGGPGYTFTDIPPTTAYVRGDVAMLTNGAEAAYGSRFVVFLADYDGPKRYPIVGRVVDGFETLAAIAADPSNPAVIVRVTIEERSID